MTTTPTRRRSIILLVAAVLVCLGIYLAWASGCQSGDVGNTQARIQQVEAQLLEVQQRATADAAFYATALANATAAGNAGAAAAAQSDLDKANKAKAQAEEWAKKLAEAKAVLAAATAADGSINPGGAIGAVGTVLPPPWGLLLTIGGPLVVGLLQELRVRQKNNAAVSIISGIEAAKERDAVLRASLKSNSPTLLANYTDHAKALITSNTPVHP